MSDEVKRYSYGYVDDGYGMRTLGLIEKPDGNLVLHTDFNALLTENLEQARLLGMSAERELALLAERDRMAAALDEIGGLCRALRQGGPDPMDLEDLSNALEQAVDTAHAALQGEQP